MKSQHLRPLDGARLKRLLLTAGIAVGMSATLALAQHESMPGHQNMPPGEHAKHEAQEGAAGNAPSKSKDRTPKAKAEPAKGMPDRQRHKKR